MVGLKNECCVGPQRVHWLDQRMSVVLAHRGFSGWTKDECCVLPHRGFSGWTKE